MALTDIIGKTLRGAAAGLGLYVAGCTSISETPPTQTEIEMAVRSSLEQHLPYCMSPVSSNAQIEELKILSIGSKGLTYEWMGRKSRKEIWPVSVHAKGTCDKIMNHQFPGQYEKKGVPFSGECQYYVGKESGKWFAEIPAL